MKGFDEFLREEKMPGYRKLFRFGPVTGLKFDGKKDPRDRFFSRGETDSTKWYTAGNHELWVKKDKASADPDPDTKIDRLPADFSYKDHFKQVAKSLKKQKS